MTTMLYCAVIAQVSLRNLIHDWAANRRGDKIDCSMTWRELLNNITRLGVYYFYSNDDQLQPVYLWSENW